MKAKFSGGEVYQRRQMILCRLADRVDKYDKENGNSIIGVVIEALEFLL